MTEAAQAAYEAYVAAKPHSETALDWDELDTAYVAAWEAVAAAAAFAYRQSHEMQLVIEAARTTGRQEERVRIRPTLTDD
jgi:hypothetical protein